MIVYRIIDIDLDSLKIINNGGVYMGKKKNSFFNVKEFSLVSITFSYDSRCRLALTSEMLYFKLFFHND